MGRRKRLLVPGAEDAMAQLKAQVIADQTTASKGRTSSSVRSATSSPQNDASVGQVAANLGIPYAEDNADLTARQAGKIGGQIGGPMVKRLISLAEQQLQQNSDEA